MIQIPLNLSFKERLNREDFYLSSSNNAAVSFLDRWPDWPHSTALIVGASGSGKTHLCSFWLKEKKGCFIEKDHLEEGLSILDGFEQETLFLIDDLDKKIEGSLKAQEAVYALYNHSLLNGKTLVGTASSPPTRWSFLLKDASSRVLAMPIVKIAQPDDDLLSALLLKQFNDRQLSISPRVLEYIVPRIERDFSAVKALLDCLDHLSLSKKTAITVSLVRNCLESQNHQEEAEEKDPIH